MSESWQQVVEEADVSAMKPSDEAGLGPPPRELTPAHEKYIRLAKPSFAWLAWTFAVLSVGSFALMLAIVPFETQMLTQALFPALIVGLAIWLGRSARQKRATLRSALRNGVLRFARVEQNIQIRVGRGLARKYRYHVLFDVDGTRVPLVSYNDGLSMLENGSLIEVVYDPATPGEIIPTFLLH